MTEIADREPIVTVDPFTIVQADPDELPEYWLLREDEDPFPIHLDELHTLMDAIDAFHDQAHPH